jgi:hypothetical protein
MPGGLGDDLIMNSFPTPYLQLGLGLFFDTDLMVRYVPKLKNQGAEFGLFGVGFKHNLMQYFGFLDKLPLNISALGSYSKMNLEYQLSSVNTDQMVNYARRYVYHSSTWFIGFSQSSVLWWYWIRQRKCSI